MHQNGYLPDTANAIARYFSAADLPSQQETLGQIVVDILRDGRHLNRLEQASTPEEERHYQGLISLLFGND